MDSPPLSDLGRFLYLKVAMKLSVSKDYPGYNPLAAPHCEVYLNGEKLSNCVAADDERGTAECIRVDKNSALMHEDGELVMETRRGNVCIVVPARAFY
jgi:hypothetical protein